MKKILRFGFSLLMGAVCIGILDFDYRHVKPDASWWIYMPLFPQTMIASIFIGVGVIGALIGFIFYPIRLCAALAEGMKRAEAKLSQLPMQDVSIRYFGFDHRADILHYYFLLLLTAFLFPWLSMLLSVIVYVLLGYLGVAVAVRTKV